MPAILWQNRRVAEEVGEEDDGITGGLGELRGIPWHEGYWRMGGRVDKWMGGWGRRMAEATVNFFIGFADLKAVSMKWLAWTNTPL